MERRAESFGRRQRAENQHTSLRIERAQTCVKVAGQLFGRGPVSPWEDDGGRVLPRDLGCGDFGRKHDADAFGTMAPGLLGQTLTQISPRYFEKKKTGTWRIVTQADTRRRQCLARFVGRGRGRFGRSVEWLDGACHVADLLGCDGAWTVDDHGRLSRIKHGGFDAVFRRACVENGIDAALEIAENVSGGGWADVAEDVGAGRGDRYTSRADQLEGDRMRRHAHADERTSGSDGIRHGRRAGKKQCDGARPERLHELFRRVRDVRDQGIEH